MSNPITSKTKKNITIVLFAEFAQTMVKIKEANEDLIPHKIPPNASGWMFKTSMEKNLPFW